MTDRYRAVTGNVSVEQARLLLRELALSGWKQQAGFVPPVADEPLPAAVQHKVALLPIIKIGHDCGGGIAEFVELRLSRWLRGKGWICGSSALDLVLDGESLWHANDIDVFAVDEAAYQDIIQASYYIHDQKRSSAVLDIEFIDPFNQVDYAVHINLVCPPPGVTWHDIGSVLANFDLSCCAVGIVDDHWAAALYPEDIEKRVFRYMKSQFPLRTIVRIGKYISRGFQPEPAFYKDLWQDKRMVPVLNMINDFNATAYHQDIMRDIVQNAPADGSADSWYDEEPWTDEYEDWYE